VLNPRATQPTIAATICDTGYATTIRPSLPGCFSPSPHGPSTRQHWGPCYSTDDLDRLRRISDLLDAGLNLAGIAMVVHLEQENEQLRQQRGRAGVRRVTRP